MLALSQTTKRLKLWPEFDTANLRGAKTAIRWGILAIVILYLCFRLTQIGWADIVQSLPLSPLFVGLSFLAFFVPIIADKIALNLRVPQALSLPFNAFVQKHVLNKAVITYSGEAYLAHRLSELDAVGKKDAWIAIKDVSLVRTFVANFWVIVLVLSAIVAGNTGFLREIVNTSPKMALAVGALCFGACAILLVFFRQLTKMSPALSAKIALSYLVRSAAIAAILVTQWSIAIPGTAVSTWFLFLVVFVLTRKSPIGGEIVFVSVVLALPGLEAEPVQLAAMLIAILALNQASYLLAGLISFGKIPGISGRIRGLSLDPQNR